MRSNVAYDIDYFDGYDEVVTRDDVPTNYAAKLKLSGDWFMDPTVEPLIDPLIWGKKHKALLSNLEISGSREAISFSQIFIVDLLYLFIQTLPVMSFIIFVITFFGSISIINSGDYINFVPMVFSSFCALLFSMISYRAARLIKK